MRSKLKPVLLALFAAFALSALASASASAASCTKEGSEPKAALCIEKVRAAGEVAFAAKLPPEGKATFKTGGLTWTCEKVEDHGILTAVVGGKVITVSKRVVELSNCSASNNCSLKQPIVLGKANEAPGLEGEVSLSGGAFQLSAFPANKGTTFGTMTLTGAKCLLAGSYKVTAEGGKSKVGPICALPNAREEAVAHTAECRGANSHLEFGAKPAELEMTETIALSGTDAGKTWSLFEG
jgi:hypothetical protein